MKNAEALEILEALLEITRGDVHEAIEAAVRVMRATQDKQWHAEYYKDSNGEWRKIGRCKECARSKIEHTGERTCNLSLQSVTVQDDYFCASFMPRKEKIHEKTN